jgi:uncharacterized membrane protein
MTILSRQWSFSKQNRYISNVSFLQAPNDNVTLISMNQTSVVRLSLYQSTLKWIIYLFAAYLAGKFLLKIFPYFGLSQEFLGKYWEVKYFLVGHITGGITALVLGSTQFWKTFRNRYLSIHRWIGRIYLGAIVLGSLCSLGMVPRALKDGIPWAISLATLALVWMSTSAMAYLAIRNKNIQVHQEWMVRSYLVTFAFVSFRWFIELPYISELHGPVLLWVSWAMPLFIFQFILDWKRSVVPGSSKSK